MATDQTNETQVVIAMHTRQFWGIAATGALVGLFGWIVYRALGLWVFEPLFCPHLALAACSSAATAADAAGLLVAAGLGLFLLVRLQVFRPLFIGLAALLTLWGSLTLASELVWYWALLVLIGLFAAAYLLFGWVGRLRSFLLAVITAVVILIIVRAILAS